MSEEDQVDNQQDVIADTVIDTPIDIKEEIVEAVEQTMQASTQEQTSVADLMTSTDKIVINQAITDLLDKCRAAGDYETPHAFQRLEKYVDKMTDSASKTILSEDEGSLQQLELLRAINQIFNNTPGELFRQAYNLFLKVVRDNIDGCFAATMWPRYLDVNTLDREQKNTFARVMNLIVRTCRTDRTQIAKQVDIARTLEGFSEDAVSRVTNFYRT